MPQYLVDPLHQFYFFLGSAIHTRDLSSVLVDDKSGRGLHHKAPREAGFRVHVDPDNFQAPGVPGREVAYDRFDHPAEAAPLGPEFEKHEFRPVEYLALEGICRCVDGYTGEVKRRLALSANRVAL